MKKKLPVVVIAATACMMILPGCGNKSHPEKTGEAWVSAHGGLRMRETPDLQGKVIITIPVNEKVTITEKKDEQFNVGEISGHWNHVSYKGLTGWVFDGFLSATKPEITDMPPEYHGEYWRDNNEGIKASDPLGGAIKISISHFHLSDEGQILQGQILNIHMIDGGISFTVRGHYESGQDVSSRFEKKGQWSIHLVKGPAGIMLKCPEPLPEYLNTYCGRTFSRHE